MHKYLILLASFITTYTFSDSEYCIAQKADNGVVNSKVESCTTRPPDENQSDIYFNDWELTFNSKNTKFRESVPSTLIDWVNKWSEATLNGDNDAAFSLLNSIFLSSPSFKYKDPAYVSGLFDIAIRNGIEFDVYKFDEKIEQARMCAEADPFDMEHFIEINNINREDSPWKWARINSENNGDMKLTFQLICRGGYTNAEFGWAVKEFYNYWKSDVEEVFMPCSYAAGRRTMSGCDSGILYK